jgi:hypothetical protein
MTRSRLVPDSLPQRYAQIMGPQICFVCCQLVGSTHGWVRAVSSLDSHSRIAHDFCWKLVMRYAQDKISEQAVR